MHDVKLKIKASPNDAKAQRFEIISILFASQRHCGGIPNSLSKDHLTFSLSGMMTGMHFCKLQSFLGSKVT
jgi:hypothetical protein